MSLDIIPPVWAAQRMVIMAHTKNMTEGKPFPIILAYFVPVLCSTLCQQLYSIIDTIVVGKGIDDMAVRFSRCCNPVPAIMRDCARRLRWE